MMPNSSETDEEQESSSSLTFAVLPRKSSLKSSNTQNDLDWSRRSTMSAPAVMQPSSKNVRFGTVDIREYERALSDNPSVTSGPAIGIGWRYEKHESLELAQYEQYKTVPPRKGVQLQIPRTMREEMLRETGVSRSELVKATRDANIDKRRRKSTVGLLGNEKLHVVMESCKRKIKRFLICEPSSKKQQEMLWEKANQDEGLANEALSSTESLSSKQNAQQRRLGMSLAVVCLIIPIIILLCLVLTRHKSDGGSTFSENSSISPAPTLSPAPIFSKVPVTIVIWLDDLPWETGWTLECDNIIVAAGDVGSYAAQSSQVILETKWVRDGAECIFLIFDSGNDGLCCEGTMRMSISTMLWNFWLWVKDCFLCESTLNIRLIFCYVCRGAGVLPCLSCGER